MLGRRVAVLFRFPAQPRVYRALTVRPHAVPFSPSTIACYATGGRPRKAVGEPSRPVKRAVKRAPSTPGARQAASGKEAKAKKTKKTAKKPATKAKKVLTEKQKESQQKRKEKAKIAELKKLALSPPRVKKLSAFMVFTAEKRKGSPSAAGQPEGERRELFAQASRDVAREWRNLPTAEIEHYNHLANTARQESEAAYKQWVQSNTVEEIQKANSARRSLRRAFPSAEKRQSKWPAIQDERDAKRPISGYLQFSVERNHSGDFRNIAVADRAKRIAQEWRELSDAQKQKYKNLQVQDSNRYVSEHSSGYGHPQTAAAAA